MTDDASEAGGIPGKRSLRPLGGVLAAMVVSLTGTRISVVALPWFVLVTTGSATQTGLVAFCEMAPYVVVKAFTGLDSDVPDTSTQLQLVHDKVMPAFAT